jgi:hypothetical protein
MENDFFRRVMKTNGNRVMVDDRLLGLGGSTINFGPNWADFNEIEWRQVGTDREGELTSRRRAVRE